MIIEPSIRKNVMVNAHPIGCKQNVLNQIEYIKKQEKFEGPKNVLVIGGSSGYGLASRIALAFGADANTINVSYEAAPKGKRTGTAGYWNNVFFQQEAKKEGLLAKDFVGDAFSNDMKKDVINYLKENNIKIDFIIYSLASGRRTDPETGETYISALRSTTKPIVGETIDFKTGTMQPQTMELATEDDLFNTVKVMGGEDWELWVNALKDETLLNEGVKTIAYTYIGPKATYDIYRNGTIGKAKEHLEATSEKMNTILKDELNGESLISSSKAIISKASSYIPIFPVYGAILFKIMKEHGNHEDPIDHKYRLIKDMVYGNKREVDEKGILRPDNWELKPEIQEIVNNLLESATEENLRNISDLDYTIKEFHKISGFMFDEVDYNEDVDMETLSNIILE
jgi:enoyl-[acyl-carrier protein] reductase/trans-2-enoyl-CoA reductase (NAD+)